MGGQLKGRRREPTPPPTHPTMTHHTLQLGLLEWGSHHRQDLSPKGRVGSRPLLQDLGGRQGRLASARMAVAGPTEGGGGRLKLASWKPSFVGERKSRAVESEGPQFRP